MQDKTQTTQKKPRTPQQPMNQKELLGIIKQGVKGELHMRWLQRKHNMKPEDLEKEAMYQAKTMDSNHKRWFRSSRKNMIQAGIYEARIAEAALILTALMKIAEINNDIMLESDLRRVQLMDVAKEETTISLNQGIDYIDMYL